MSASQATSNPSLRLRAVVLAAGKGTRMKSARPKMLHHLCGRAMLWHVLRALAEAGVRDVVVVTSAEIADHVEGLASDAGHAMAAVVLQEPQLGSGHAVQVALAALAPADGTLLVLNGDMPLVEAELIRTLLAAHAQALTLVTARMPLPSSFGRIVRHGDGTSVAKIVEARDADPGELELDEMNAGLYAFDERKLRAAIAELRNDNAQAEYYLTDTVAQLPAAGERVRAAAGAPRPRPSPRSRKPRRCTVRSLSIPPPAGSRGRRPSCAPRRSSGRASWPPPARRSTMRAAAGSR